MIELLVTDMMIKAADNRAHLLMLRERDGLRKVILALGVQEAHAIASVLRNVKTPALLPHQLLVEFAGLFGIKMNYSLIYDMRAGIFLSKIFFEQDGVVKTLYARTSDIIALAIRTKSPIFITEELLDQICVRDEKNGAISVPISIADEDTLLKALDTAVEEENYELAMKLKEEIDARHRDGKSDNDDINTK